MFYVRLLLEANVGIGSCVSPQSNLSRYQCFKPRAIAGLFAFPVYINAQGAGVSCALLLAHLPFSQYVLGWSVPIRRPSASIYGLIRVFEALGGTTQRIIVDNLKAAIAMSRIDRFEAGEAQCPALPETSYD